MALLVSPASVAAGLNLLANGDFSAGSQLAAWQCGATQGSDVTWSTDDAGAAIGVSGSLRLRAAGYFDEISMSPMAGSALCISVCVGVSPGSRYRIAMQYRTVSGASPPVFQCATYTNATCTGAFPTVLGSPNTTSTTQWSAASTAAVAPAGALSAHCVAQEFDLSTTIAEVDDLILVPDAIYGDGFESIVIGDARRFLDFDTASVTAGQKSGREIDDTGTEGEALAMMAALVEEQRTQGAFGF